MRVWSVGVVVLLFAHCGSVSFAQRQQRPNVVVIYTDDQGYGDASCLNEDAKFQTPNIDRLAREGMTFADGHCSDTVCTPSRYGLLTGRYSWRTELKRGVFGAERECLIEDGRMTLASMLHDNGYATAMVGKWHLGMDFPGTDAKNRDWSQPVRDMPLDKGFDYFWGIPASMNYGVLAWFDGRHAAVPPTLFTRKKPNAIAISDYRIMPPYEDTAVRPNDLETAPDFVDSECLTRFTDKAINWVQGKAEAARGGKPFFLYLPYTSPHKPVIPIDRFQGKSAAGAYGDFMLETDWHIGRLLQLLDDERLTDNTLVFFSSDNGPETTFAERIKRFAHHSAGPYREGKRSIYEGGHRVPFIVRWPSHIKPGSRCDVTVCQTDLLATLAEINETELPVNAGEDSISFLPSLLGQVHERPAVIHHAANGRFAVRDGQWKLVMQWKNQPQELYELDIDPTESNDARMSHRDLAARLQRTITDIVRNGRSSPGAAQKNDVDWWADLAWLKP